MENGKRKLFVCPFPNKIFHFLLSGFPIYRLYVSKTFKISSNSIWNCLYKFFCSQIMNIMNINLPTNNTIFYSCYLFHLTHVKGREVMERILELKASNETRIRKISVFFWIFFIFITNLFVFEIHIKTLIYDLGLFSIRWSILEFFSNFFVENFREIFSIYKKSRNLLDLEGKLWLF